MRTGVRLLIKIDDDTRLNDTRVICVMDTCLELATGVRLLIKIDKD